MSVTREFPLSFSGPLWDMFSNANIYNRLTFTLEELAAYATVLTGCECDFPKPWLSTTCWQVTADTEEELVQWRLTWL